MVFSDFHGFFTLYFSIPFSMMKKTIEKRLIHRIFSDPPILYLQKNHRLDWVALLRRIILHKLIPCLLFWTFIEYIYFVFQEYNVFTVPHIKHLVISWRVCFQILRCFAYGAFGFYGFTLCPVRQMAWNETTGLLWPDSSRPARPSPWMWWPGCPRNRKKPPSRHCPRVFAKMQGIADWTDGFEGSRFKVEEAGCRMQESGLS